MAIRRVLVGLLGAMAVVIVLAYLFVPLMDDGTTQHRARQAKMRADLKSVASAVEGYRRHCGKVPSQAIVFQRAAPAGSACEAADLGDLLRVQTIHGRSAGPFIDHLPRPSNVCKDDYSYVGDGARFQVAYVPVPDDHPSCVAFAVSSEDR